MRVTGMKYASKFGRLAVALALTACGGGGGSGGMPPVQPPTTLPTANSFRTAEYNLMGALDAVHAADAYALGYTGLGVTIGMVDFNFSLGSSEVNYSSASVDKNPQMVSIYEAQIGQQAAADLHGHAVAAVAAARKNDSGIHGIAF